MLQAIRDQLVGWVAWGILILISVPFIFMGVTDFAAPAKETIVAEIDGEFIKQQDYQRSYQSRRADLQRQLGTNYRPDIFDDKIRQGVIDNMVEEQILQKIAIDNNFQIGDSELASVIRQDRGFYKDNKFDYSLYKTRLGQAGYTVDRYENSLRVQRKINTVPRLVQQSSFVTKQELERYHQLANQKRDADYIVIGSDHFPDELQVSDEEARAHYDKSLTDFVRPAQVRIEYIRLSASELVDSVKATEENMRAYYEENADAYVVEGQRRASHILLSIEEGKSLEDSPEVAKKLKEIQDKLAAGEKFSDLATEYSDDSGSAQLGGDLGQVLRGDMVAPFEDALFALTEVGQISAPVITSFGVHLIKLLEITPRQVKAFEDVKPQIAKGFAEKQAIELYYDRAEKMAEISYEKPDSLLPVVEALDLKIKKSGWLSADNEAEGIEGNKDVLNAAFSERLKTELINSDPIEVGINDVVILRVAETRPESQLSFEEVIEQARDAAKKDLMAQKIKEYSDALLTRLQSGESIADLAKKENLKVESVAGLQRQDNSLPAVLSREIFAASMSPGAESAATSVLLDDNQMALIVLRKIILPETASDSEASKDLKNRAAVNDTRMVISGLRDKANIVIYKDKL